MMDLISKTGIEITKDEQIGPIFKNIFTLKKRFQ